jgi:hypothetical protein
MVHAQDAATAETSGPLIVQVGVMNVLPDGKVGGYAVLTGEKDADEFGGGVIADACRSGAGDNWVAKTMPAWGTDAWEIRGKVIKLSADQATVQMDWRRVRSSGQATDEPLQSKVLTLPLGQLVTLDTTALDSNSACPSRSVIFGARYAPKYPRSNGPSAGSSVTPAAGRPSNVNVPSYDAELWLVHAVAGRPDVVLPLLTRTNAGTAKFEFASVQVPIANGLLNVRINGQLRVATTTPQPMLMFSATRSTTFAPSGRPARDTQAEVDRGNAAVSKRLPAPDDVIEFEMPPFELRGLPAVPDTFAIRLRIKPVK